MKAGPYQSHPNGSQGLERPSSLQLEGSFWDVSASFAHCYVLNCNQQRCDSSLVVEAVGLPHFLLQWRRGLVWCGCVEKGGNQALRGCHHVSDGSYTADLRAEPTETGQDVHGGPCGEQKSEGW